MENLISERIQASCFFNLKSPHKLADLLGITLGQLEDLAANGEKNYRQFDNDGRWIETPLKPLKRVQRRIHNLLTRIPPPEFLFSAYQGKSSVENALQHQAGVPMVKMDIRRFYPSTDGALVYELFSKTFHCAPHISAYLKKLCTIGQTRNSTHCHLPTGGVTSPILSYFCYRKMFESLKDLASRNNLTLSVFADDITLSGKLASHSTIAQAKTIFREYGLVSNSRKEKVWSSKHGNKLVTGVIVTKRGGRVPFLRKKKIGEIKDILSRATDPKDRSKLYQQLHGCLASAGQIEPRYLVGARCVLAEWKSDFKVWSVHTKESQNKKR